MHPPLPSFWPTKPRATAKESTDPASSQRDGTQVYGIFLIYSSGHENVDLASYGLKQRSQGKQQKSFSSSPRLPKPGCISKAFSGLHIANLTPRPSKLSRLLSLLSTHLWLRATDDRLPSRALMTHLLFSALWQVPESTDNTEGQGDSAPEVQASTAQAMPNN